MDVDRTLKRIAYTGSTEPTLETLQALQRAFLLSVPFENLDVHLGRPISLNPEDVYRKIVIARRGGFCYECNGLFHELLTALGYRVDLLSARMTLGTSAGLEFDHMVLLVGLDREYLVDVGNGQSCRAPLALGRDDESESEEIAYRLAARGPGHALEFRETGGDWAPRFVFDRVPRQRAEFLSMCEFHQTSSDSPFTRGRLVTIAREEGRTTLAGRCLAQTRGTQRQEVELTSEAEVLACLRNQFGIELAG